jgi:glycosyltransferase involved in cell wall biosynthesis
MQDTEVHVSVLGDGPMMSHCHDLAAQLGVQERIRFHGVIPDAGSLLSAFDGLVLTSWTEGTPMVLLEAMAAGLPIVTTAVGGIPDVVSSREALLCEAGDVEALARGIEIVVGDADTAQAMADRAMARVSLEFGVEEWVARHADIYSDARRNLGIAKSSSIFRGLCALGGRAVR